MQNNLESNVEGVDAYINGAPKETRAKLSELRSIIRSAAPKALEVMSYGN